MNFCRIEQFCKDLGLANVQGYLYLFDGDGEKRDSNSYAVV